MNHIFSAEDLRLVVSALREVRLLWRVTQDEKFVNRAAQRLEGNYRAWTPANLALLVLGLEIRAEELAEESIPAIPTEISQQALERYDNWIKAYSPPKTLADAGLLALALREIRRTSGTWNEVHRQIIQSIQAGDKLIYENWAVVLACLIGMVVDGRDLLKGLMGRRVSSPIYELIGTAVFSTPMSVDEQASSLLNLMAQLTPGQQINWLRRFRYEGRRELVGRIAAFLLKTNSGLATTGLLSMDKNGHRGMNASIVMEGGDLETSLSRLFDLERLAILYYYCGQPAQAQSLVRAAQNLSRYTLAGIELQLLDEEYQLQPGENREDLLRALQSSLSLRSELALNESACNLLVPELLESSGDFWSAPLSGNGHSSETGTGEPMLRLRQAKLIAENGDIALAREIAKQVTRQWCESVYQKPDSFAPAFVYDWKPESFIRILQGLGLQAETIQFIEACLLIRPNDIQLIQEYQAILQANQLWKEAKEITNSLQFFEPHNAEWHRRMAEVLTGMEDYSGALKERQTVMRLAAEPGLADWYGLAVAADRTGDGIMAVQACREVLRVDPNHGGANALVGQSLAHEGKSEEAINYLSRATLSAPEEAQPWLVLADLYEQREDSQRALETLRAAVLAAPGSGDIQYALGLKYILRERPSEALPVLKEARRLSPSNALILLSLGKLLRQLGLHEESCRVLREGCVNWPQNGDFYVEYGQTCMAYAELENAIPAFEKAVQLNPKCLDWIYFYVEALLSLPFAQQEYATGSKYRPAFQRACKVLEDRVLDDEKPPLKERYLLGELLFVMGELASAYELYRALLDDPEATQPDWRWRIQAGFGRTALRLGQKESALAALREASQEQPQNIEVLQWLVEASRANKLEKEAIENARITMKLAPNNLKVLAWFADVMAQLGRSDEAVQALECTLQLDPTRVENWLKLIEVYLRAGEASSARATLQKFLLCGGTDADTLQKIAYACVRLEDLPQAIDCLERAIGLDATARIEIQIVLAVLYEKTGQLERAVECLQSLALLIANDPIVLVLQADILLRSGRMQAAAACLEQALGLWGSANGQAKIDFSRNEEWEILVEKGLVTAEWLEKLSSPSAAHWRFAGINNQAGNWDAVQYHVEQAVSISSFDRELRYAAADCIAGLLKYEQALKLLDQMPVDAGAMNDQSGYPSDQVGGLEQDILALRAELLIETGRTEGAARVIEQGLRQFPYAPRLMILQARELSRQGRQLEAEEILDAVLAQSIYPTLWMAQGLLEIGRFEEALTILAGMPAQNGENHDPYGSFAGWSAEGLGNPRAAFEYGRAMVICAEQAFLREGLKIEAHVPLKEDLDETHFISMTQFLQTALKASRSQVVERWLARGRLVFHPSAQAALELANLTPQMDDIPALVMGLRRLNRTGNALQWAQKYPEQPFIMLQMALCMLKFDAANGLQVMRRAVELRPSDPIFQAGLALLASQAVQSQSSVLEGKEDLQGLASRALEMACSIWPDEPVWHYWAAEIDGDLRQELSMLRHLERAFVLRPQWFDVAHALGKAYLANHQADLAIEILGRAVDLAPTRGDVCYSLAIANRVSNRLNEALVNAERAASLDRQATAPLLLCAEVAFDLGKLVDAERFAQSAAQRDKNDISVILFLSQVKEKQGNREAAFVVLEDAVKSFPSNLHLLVERARLAKQVKGSKAALQMVDEVMRQFPNEFRILQLMADVQFECGNLVEAEKVAIQALQLQPADPVLSLLMGRIQQRNGQLDLAVRYFSDVVRRQPDLIEAYLDLGNTYQQRREYRKALGTYQRARELAPKDYRVYFESANVLKEIKDYQNAEEMLRRAVELSPQDISIRKQLSAVMALNLIQNSPAQKGHSEEVTSHR